MLSYRSISRRLMALWLLSTGAAFAQTVSVVSGQGQIVRSSNIIANPLVVLVRNAAGNPVTGATVTWKLSTGGGTVLHPTSTTDSNGQTSNSFIGANVISPTSFAQSVVSATYQTASVGFYVTTAGVDTSSGTIFVQAIPSSPAFGQLPLVGQSGQVGSIPVKIRAQAI